MSDSKVTADVVTITTTPGGMLGAASFDGTVPNGNEGLAVTVRFEVTGRPLYMRVGTTTPNQPNRIVPETKFEAGEHYVTFTPNVSPWTMQFILREEGVTTVNVPTIHTGPIEFNTPYPTIADIENIRHDQSLNTMFLTDGNAEPHLFERRGTNSWSLRPFRPTTGPWTPINADNDLTLRPDAQTGETTIVASKPYFKTSDVGSLLRLAHAGQFVTGDLSGATQSTNAIRVTGIEDNRSFNLNITGTFTGTVVLERSVGNEFTYETVNTYSGPISTTINDTFDNQIIYYRLRMDSYTSGTATATLNYSQGYTTGIARITGVSLDTLANVTILEPFGKAGATNGPTPLWYQSLWTPRFGYPQAVALYDGRLWYARQSTYWASGSDSFADFNVGALPNEAIQRTFGGQMSQVRWLSGAKRLLVGLSGGEYEINSNTRDDVILPSNVKSRIESTNGAANANPAVVGQSALYITRSKKRIYEFGYSRETGELDVSDLNRLNEDIGGVGGFKEIAWQQEPQPRLWAVRTDGQLAVCLYNRRERIAAWCRMKLNGNVRSVCVLPGTPNDTVLVCVERMINGSATHYIEKVGTEDFTVVEDAWHLGSALLYSGAATDTVTGLNHLANEEVYAWADGRENGPLTVAGDGSVTIGYAASKILIGKRLQGLYKSSRMNWGASGGAALTAYKQLEDLGMILHNTTGGALEWGDNFTDMEKLKDRLQSQDGNVYNGPLQLWNQDTNFPIDGSTHRDVRIHMRMPSAGPATVLGLVPDLKVNA